MLEVFFRSSVGARERIHRMWPLELMSELETLSGSFIYICGRCSLGDFVGAVTVVVVTRAWSWARASQST
jgi:hypothetical protein